MEELIKRFEKATSTLNAGESVQRVVRNSLETLVSGVRKDSALVSSKISRYRTLSGGCGGCNATPPGGAVGGVPSTLDTPHVPGGGMPLPQHYFGGHEEAAFFRGGEGSGVPESADSIGGWAPTGITTTQAHAGVAMAPMAPMAGGGSSHRSQRHITVPRKVTLPPGGRATLSEALEILANNVRTVVGPGPKPPTAKSVERAIQPLVKKLVGPVAK